MSRKGQSITLSVSARDKAQLEAIALDLGFTWGDRPNISKLIEAIAQRKLLIAPNHDWPAERINALNLARNALIDNGQIEAAIAIAHLLVERSETSLPLQSELTQFIENPIQPWRLEVERYIKRQKPFKLSYQDAAENLWHFTIQYAEITTHEDRQYLDCWCQETTGSQDLPELIHNRCLRLDRIHDAVLAPTEGTWRSRLDTIPVEIYLTGGLAFAYQSKTSQDEVNEWLSDPPHVRRVVRRVSSAFWFMREVLRYGKDCEVRSPAALRDRIQQELAQMSAKYADMNS